MKLTFTQVALATMTLLCLFAKSEAQIISRFDFNSTATLMQATTGPNGTSISPVAVAPNGSAYITSGCGAGIGMNLGLPGTVFDVDNITIRTRFRRGATEGTGNFFERDQLVFGFVGGRLFARWAIVQGGGVQLRVLTTNQVVSTSEYREYEFRYDNCTGEATILDNGVVVGFADFQNNRPIAWNSGDAFIGTELDNACNQTEGYDWVVISGNNTGCLVNLPVELASFEARPSASGVRISWATSSEVNNDFFTVERSRDGATFEAIQEVPGAGTSQEYLRYAVEDPDPQSGQRFYRLRQTDFDGTTTLSAVVEVQVEGSESPFSIAPNPSQGQLQVQLPGAGTVEVCDLTGKTLLKRTLKEAFPQVIPMDLGTLKNGLYLVRFYAEGKVQTQKLLLQN